MTSSHESLLLTKEELFNIQFKVSTSNEATNGPVVEQQQHSQNYQNSTTATEQKHEEEKEEEREKEFSQESLNGINEVFLSF